MHCLHHTGVHFCFARIAFQTVTRRQILSLPIPRREIISKTKLLCQETKKKLLHPGKFAIRLLCFKFKWNAKFQHVTDSISLSSLPYPIVALKLTAISRQRVCEVKPLGRAGYFYFQFARRTCIPSTSQNRSMWKRPFLDGNNEYSREDTVADGSKRAWKPSAGGWVPFWKQLAQRLPHRVIKRHVCMGFFILYCAI